MRRGFTAFSANNAVDLTRIASIVVVDTLMKWRRFILPYSCCKASVPDTVGVSQKGHTMEIVTRREAAKIIGTAAAGLMLPTDASEGETKAESSAMLTRT